MMDFFNWLGRQVCSIIPFESCRDYNTTAYLGVFVLILLIVLFKR